MPSNQTSNYALSQWSKDDQVLMEDFNADNAKIDGALAAEKAEREAAVTSINAALSGMVKFAAGSYVGDGAASRVISVGFTPKAVYLCTNFGVTHGEAMGYQIYGGLAVTDSPLLFSFAAQPVTAMEIVSGGFRVMYKSLGNYTVQTNGGATYHYIAIG